MFRSLCFIWNQSSRTRPFFRAKSPRRRGSHAQRFQACLLERLEDRLLLATLVSASKVTYQDVDGDTVTVSFSKSFLTPANVDDVFKFHTGNIDGSNAVPQRLNQIILSGIPAAAKTNITTSSALNANTGGDGLATLGQIDATGLDLGKVTIDGDLGRLLAGDADPATEAVGAVKVHSMGRFGTTTGAHSLHGVIEGRLASLAVQTDVVRASIAVQGGVHGRLGAVTIGGSLIGGPTDSSGRIFSTGDMGAVRINGNITAGAGSGYQSGSIVTGGKLKSVTIGQSMTGGAGVDSARISSVLDMGAVKIGEHVTAGGGQGSGSIVSLGKLSSVTIGGHLTGGAGVSSANIGSVLDMGAVKVNGNISGGGGTGSGYLLTNGKLKSVTIGGSLKGGDGYSSGTVFSGLDTGSVRIAGDLRGGTGDRSGYIDTSGKLAGLTVGGSLVGGGGEWSGAVYSQGDMGAVKISGDIAGGAGRYSGNLGTNGKLKSVALGGSLAGAAGVRSGVVSAFLDAGAVRVAKNVSGSTGAFSGSIRTYGKLDSVMIGGSLIGGSANFSGSIGAGDFKKLTIEGDLVGGSASGSASLEDAGTVRATRIGTMTVGGSLIAGTDSTTGDFGRNGAILAAQDIGKLTIRGNLVGNSTNAALIGARGQSAPGNTTDVAIGRITVHGSVEFTRIAAGVDLTGAAQNADAQIGQVTVGGDWIASDLVAGAVVGASGFFGDGDDAKMSGTGVKDEPNVFSRIGSIAIGGQAIGTPAGGDHFGLVAENIGSLKIGGSKVPLVAGNGNDNILLDAVFADVRLREI